MTSICSFFLLSFLSISSTTEACITSEYESSYFSCPPVFSDIIALGNLIFYVIGKMS